MRTSPRLPQANRGAGPARSAWHGIKAAQWSPRTTALPCLSLSGSRPTPGKGLGAPDIHTRHLPPARVRLLLQTTKRDGRARTQLHARSASLRTLPPRHPPSSRRWPLCSPQGPVAGPPGAGSPAEGHPFWKALRNSFRFISGADRELASIRGRPPAPPDRRTGEHGVAEPDRRKLQTQSQP